jgi:nucleotide-binding universal stress UspA family protein
MQTILVPTDFSATANNALTYAIAFAKQIQATQLVLINTFIAPPPIIGDVLTPSFITPNIDAFKQISETGLAKTKNEFATLATDNGIDIIVHSVYAELVDGIEMYCKENPVDIIIMGITGGNLVEEKLIGSNTITVAKQLHIPVIIVPAKAKFTLVEEVLLATDLKHVIERTPITQIQAFLKLTQAKLFVLHVHLQQDKISEVEQDEANKLEQLFAANQPVFNEVINDSFTDAVNTYADNNAVDIIITIPKKRRFFESLFSTSHTNMLAFHSHVPLMVLHD